MCGRFTLTADGRELMDQFRLPFVPEDYRPRYNVAPGQPVLAVRDKGGGERSVAMVRWGLIPSWAKDEKIGYKMINARAETVGTRPAFRRAFAKRRCIIPADGFFEWRREGNKKVPLRFCLKSRRLFAMAGLWEVWRPPTSPDGELLVSCTVLTTEPNALVEPVHNRMPVLIPRDELDRWLDPEIPGEGVAHLLKTFPAEEMEGYEVSPIVNSPRNDSEECVQPVAG